MGNNGSVPSSTANHNSIGDTFKNSKNIIISYPDNSDEVSFLPVEVWSQILFLVEDQTLATIVPRVSRSFYHFSSNDSDVWKRKCEIGNQRSPLTKPETLSWKQFRLGATRFFPLFGFTINKTTSAELHIAEGGLASTTTFSSSHYSVKQVNFWVNNNVFNAIYITRGVYIIPKEWEEKGLTWDKSFNEYKEWLKNTFGNYKVAKRPQKTAYEGKQRFTSVLEAAAKEYPDVLYLIKLEFTYNHGDENTKETLYSISVSYYDENKAEYEQRFSEHKCDDGFTEEILGKS